jgi:CDP-6-deoxy-D-xylo-4-hexulose-3-dehydrase
MTKEKIFEDIKQYYSENFSKKPFVSGDKIHYAGRVFDSDEMINCVDSVLDFWLTSGKYCETFEKEFAQFLGVRKCLATTSGSSADLLAFMTLTSPLLKEKQIRPGDEVITVACGFPTTVSPMIIYGAIPVFVDVTIPQYNIDVSMLEKALSPKTKAVMIAHTLGNPFDLAAVKAFCDKHHLWLIEDNCDALGSKYTINGKEVYTGTIGDIGTSSFYPAHHMTMGEGGAVYMNDPLLYRICKSMRDWGRDCICETGHDNTCGHRFDGQYGTLPFGYDHKYVYSQFGYNLKITEMQAAIGCAQLKKLPSFIEARKKHWTMYKKGLSDLTDYLVLPEACENSDPSWFGFVITCKPGVNRNRLTQHLEDAGIQTRNLFAGNLIRHPCFDQMRKEKEGYRVVGNLSQTDMVMNNTFWVGVYPGMEENMIDYTIFKIHEFFKMSKGTNHE